MSEFDIFRINCWLEDLEDYNYETSILVTTFEYILNHNNSEQPRKEIYDYISKTLGIKLQYQDFTKFTDESDDLSKEAMDDDVLIKLKPESVEKFRERFEKNSIENYIDKYGKENGLKKKHIESIKSILLKSLYININSFVVSDLKTLISESIKKEFKQKEVDLFNDFLEWNDQDKNKAIYALFSKSIEFAILTSGRGVSTISEDIFTNKTYYLDANVIIRALGVDGEQRRDSIISVLESCNHDGIKFKIAKATSDELYGIINKRSTDIKNKTSADSEKLLSTIIEDLPLNSSFETDYIRKRKAGKVKSPNNYRLSLEQELQKFIDKFQLKIETVKDIPQREITALTNRLYDAKQNEYGRRYYSKGAALVDAKNVLHVRNVRSNNNYNYKDIKSFYLTTDGTLNEIIANDDSDGVAETILPSQLFVIHNSFHKKAEEEDYNDFIKFIKLRKTDFKLPGQEIYSYLDQIRDVTSDPEDIKSSLKAYANYKYQNRNKYKESNERIIPLREYTASVLEQKLASVRDVKENYENAQQTAINKLPELLRTSANLAYFIEFIILGISAVILFLITKNTNTTLIAIGAILVFRLILFLMKDKFGFHKRIRNGIFSFYVKRQSYMKVHPNDKKYLSEIELLKNDT